MPDPADRAAPQPAVLRTATAAQGGTATDPDRHDGAQEPAESGAPNRRRIMREDYALERLPLNWRWSSRTVFMVLASIITAFFFPATGGTYLLKYGAMATFIGLAIGFVLLTSLTLVISSAASREGLTSDLLTRGCGYGWMDLASHGDVARAISERDPVGQRR